MITPVVVLVTGAVLVGATLLAVIVLRPKEQPIDVPRLVRAFVVLGLVGLVEVGIATVGLQRYFLAVNLVYTQVMILLPLTGIVVLLVGRRKHGAGRREPARSTEPSSTGTPGHGLVSTRHVEPGQRVTRGARIAAWCSLVLIPIGIDATYVEPFRLVTETATIPVAPERAMSRDLVIGVLSDIQCIGVTDRERDAVARVMATKPDLILLPGDLQQVGFDRREEIALQLRELLAPLAAPLGVYYVEGDTEDCWQARRLLAGTPVTILEDEIVRVEHHEHRLTLGGVTLNAKTSRARTILRELEEDTSSTDDVRILLSHRPDVIAGLRANTRIDLLVAGHTHGGQVQLPLLGPPITLSSVSRTIAAGGFHEFDGRRIYVSRGIGWEHGMAPRVRFLCPPEVSLVTLTNRR